VSGAHPDGLTDEQRLLAETLDRFVRERVAPCAEEIEREGLPPALVGETFREQLLQLAALPEQLGGAGGDLAMALLVAERLAAGSAALASVAASAAACTAALAAGGAGGAALERLAGGALLVLADADADAGADAGAVAAGADGDGWALEGELRSVAGARAADALLVLCDGGDAGPLACCVDVAAAGVELAPAPPGTGLRGELAATVALHGVRVAAAEAAAGVAAVRAARAQRRLGWAAAAVGTGTAALELAVSYLQERAQFGRPLGAFRALRDRVAQHAAELDAARALLHAVARRPDALGAAGAVAAARTTLVATEAAVAACTGAVQLHGGYGYTDEYAVSRLLRDAVSIRAAAGGGRALRAAGAPPALAVLGDVRPPGMEPLRTT